MNRSVFKISIIIFSLISTTSCASSKQTYPHDYFAARGFENISIDYFPHCHGYGCVETTYVALDDNTLDELEDIFTPPSKSAEQERERIATAIGLLETVVGKATGTEEDIGGTFDKTGPLQLDCADESMNTTVYLMLMNDLELLEYHIVRTPRARFPVLRGSYWPHQSAMIEEIETGEIYAVDSWFYDNGEKATIAPFREWKNNEIPDRISTDQE